MNLKVGKTGMMIGNIDDRGFNSSRINFPNLQTFNR